MLALLLMVPLAATSTNASIKRLGSARWKRLHQLAYVAAILGAIHFWMSKKADKSLPWVMAIALAVLLGYRLFKKFTGPSAAPTAVARR
jgi:sulfoxide reductase heme-binding subunit YedZ